MNLVPNTQPLVITYYYPRVQKCTHLRVVAWEVFNNEAQPVLSHISHESKAPKEWGAARTALWDTELDTAVDCKTHVEYATLAEWIASVDASNAGAQ